MPQNQRPRLGDLEQAVMDQLWSTDACLPGGPGVTVREVHDAIGVDRGLAYTTLLTVLDRLAKKGLVERERDGRAWRYTVAATRQELTSETLHDTLGQLTGDDRRTALLHFLDESTPEEIDELRAVLQEIETKHASGDRPFLGRTVGARLRRRKAT